MKVLITGASNGIGKATTSKFLSEGHTVYGMDTDVSRFVNVNYVHIQVDVRDKDKFPDIPDIDIVINNAGTQNDDDIGVNLIGAMNVTEKYGVRPGIISIVNVASVSAHTGAEFPEYCASKGGLLAYTKNVAIRVAKYGATCNSISPGGVVTKMNAPILADENLWEQIMELTPLRRWAHPYEIADWIYFVSVTNRFMTGQDIIIDGGESTDAKFIWKD